MAKGRNSPLLALNFQVHSIVDFIISQRHIVLKNHVPLFKSDLTPTGASLGHYQFLKIPDHTWCCTCLRLAFPDGLCKPP